VITTIRELFMEHGWKHRLGVVTAAAVLASGLGTNAAKLRLTKLISWHTDLRKGTLQDRLNRLT
jgi:hypothetical protein